jgi:hypothetical protein
MRACRFTPDRQPSTHSQQTSLVLPMRPQRQHFLLRLGGEAPDLPSASTVSRRFDGLLRAYELLGFTPKLEVAVQSACRGSTCARFRR